MFLSDPIRKEYRKRRRYGVFIVNFELILHLFPLFLSLTLNKYLLAGEPLSVVSIKSVTFCMSSMIACIACKFCIRHYKKDISENILNS